jgi:Uma2 family endonuclease
MSSAVRHTVRPPAVLYDIDWPTYLRLQRVLQSRRRLRLTYDRGTLEIMSPLFEHEGPAYLLGRFIDVITEEFEIPCRGGRSVTLRRKRELRGVEPDNCYWIANAPLLQGKTHLDLRVDPPPDLAVEVDVTSSSINRMSIYAALKVPEIWRLTTRSLTFQILKGGKYRVQRKSLSFPQIESAELSRFLALLEMKDDTAIVSEFRKWVRKLRG